MLQKKLLLIISVICVLVGCVSESKYHFKKPIDDVVLVQIMCVQENEEVLYETKETEILYDILELKCRRYFNDPVTTLRGTIIKIWYNDGCYEMVASDCTAYYNGKRLKIGREHFDWKQFDALINKYLA